MKPSEHIRDRAAHWGYWTAATEAERAVIRKHIAQVYPKYSRQQIADALKRASQPGCPHCGQPMPKKATP